MDVAISQLPEPFLQFGGTELFSDPKRGLVDGGPFSLRYEGGHLKELRLGIVGPAEAVDAGLKWFDRCRKTILSSKENRQRYPDFPGFEAESTCTTRDGTQRRVVQSVR